MKTWLTICLLLGSPLLSVTQELVIVAKRPPIAGQFVSFSIDHLDNIYLLTATNQLRKLAPNGDSISVFNHIKKYGVATLIDVSNPVKILLYYKGFSTIVELDGMLHLKNTIDLRRKGMFNVTAVGRSYDGNIWLYDDMENVLKKLDAAGSVIFKTADFRQLFDQALAPTKIYDHNRYVHLYDSLQGLFIFDYYGAFKNKIDLRGWSQLHMAQQYVYGFTNGQLCRYDLSAFRIQTWPLPAAFLQYRQLFFKANTLYALGEKGLEIYQVQTP